MSLLIAAILLFLFNFSLFSYSESLLAIEQNKFKTFILTGVANTAFFLLTYFLNMHEILVMSIALLLIYMEMRLLYAEKRVKCLFGALCFLVNFFAIRTVCKAFYALVTDTAFYQTTANPEIDVFCTILALLLSILYIAVFRQFIPYRCMNMVSSDMANMTFATIVLGAIYGYQVINALNLYITEAYPPIPIFQIKVGICAIIGFGATIGYAFILARLTLFQTRSNEIEKIIQTTQTRQEDLKVKASRDSFCNCYNRRHGISLLEECIKNERNFCIVFFDIDCLKLVNDNFGHNEGDCYIKAIVNVLKNVFGSDQICRMGGDEFMVILESISELQATKYAVQTYESVELLSRMSDKKYTMSISYGIAEIPAGSSLSINQILETADKRMYEFKNAGKKARALTKPKK